MDKKREVYLVGGAVRDALLGIQSKDLDYVVVGATVEEMVAEGYSMVGADFPVFLHPENGCEYALARTERKSGPGYHGFVTDHSTGITLRDDLERRDLTVNAMAFDENDRLIDYFGGLKDLELNILRHVGPAFAEDPVRVLRIARFAARYDWTIALETYELMRAMVKNGELNHLTKERVYKEFEKGFAEKKPSEMIRVLHAVGFFGLDQYSDLVVMNRDLLDVNGDWAVRMCVAFCDCKNLKERGFPNDICDAVEIMSKIGEAADAYWNTGAQDHFEKVIQRGDALRRTNQFMLALEALEVIQQASYVKIRRDVMALKKASFGDQIPAGLKGVEIKNFVDNLKVRLLLEGIVEDAVSC
jgi:hypothetical protein